MYLVKIIMNDSPYLNLLRNRIDLAKIPLSERGSRLMVFQVDHHFAIRLAERWFKLDNQLAGYRFRPPIIDQLQFTDADGQTLPTEITSYPHRVDCTTPVGVFTISFHDLETISIALPSARCGVTFTANMDQGVRDRRGGILRLTGDIRRNIAYTTNAAILANQIAPIDPHNQRILISMDASEGGRALLLNITPRLGFNRWVPDPNITIEASAKRWHDWFAGVPPVAEPLRAQYYYAWWVMRAGLISTRFYTTREAMTPSKIYYVGVWQWDAYFHALAYRHVEMNLAKDQIRILLDHQREDGMIPDAIHDEGTVTRLGFPVEADVTKPPLLAWAAWKLYETDHDAEFLNEIYEPVARWNKWWFDKNDSDNNGLCEYHHPYSSGLDDSPLWDEGMPVEAPDLNTYLCLQQEALAKMAEVIGEKADARMWRERADLSAQKMMEHMWDPEAGLFWARKAGQPVRVKTPFNLFPLITGRMPPDIAAKLVAHLTNPKEFWPRYPVPTVACDDPKYDAEVMWRGPTWVNVNYLLVEGLARAGYNDLAGELRRKTLELMMGSEDIYEYYNPATGKSPPKAASLFGWSSALFIDLAIEETRAMENKK